VAGSDYSGRLLREGEAVISREVAEIFDRIGTTAEACDPPVAHDHTRSSPFADSLSVVEWWFVL
jgi:hypothetical protein